VLNPEICDAQVSDGAMAPHGKICAEKSFSVFQISQYAYFLKALYLKKFKKTYIKLDFVTPRHKMVPENEKKASLFFSWRFWYHFEPFFVWVMF
jgi:hypothetical protein